MDFNSIIFFLYLPIVFILYWTVAYRVLLWRNLFVTVVSYTFYGFWDWRFLSLILISTLVDFIVAKRIELSRSGKMKRVMLFVSLLVNLGMLGFFKYFNFFSKEFSELLRGLGFSASPLVLDILLPVGISFYTFQTLSYTIDVYKGKIRPTDNLLQFTAYVSFFPQLVAGPIERASSLLPQFETINKFSENQIRNGLRLIIWGLSKKVIIADSLAPVVNEVFISYADQSGLDLVLGAVFFAFQIYCDFSGYSDIAIGCAKLLGFELMSNFKFPYFARDIAEFWRRWHISLSTWFRDYLYIPLGGSKGGKFQRIRNVFIIFLVSGFWHGANWTFIIWGGIHSALFLPLLLFNKNRKYTKSVIGESGIAIREILGVFLTFFLVCVGWVFFRANDVGHAVDYLGSVDFTGSTKIIHYLIYPLILVIIEWKLRFDERLKQAFLGKLEPMVLGLLMFLIFLYRGRPVEFIYFQF